MTNQKGKSEKQIPYGNDKKKSKNNDNCNCVERT